jgi:cytochrome b6
VPPGQEASTATEPGIPFFPNFLLRDLGVWLIVLNLITLLAVFFPWQLGHQADPLAPAPAGIHPEWYFMSQFELLKLLGKWFPGMAGEVLGIGLFSVGMILWGLIPLYDSRNEAGCRARLASYFGIFVVIAVIGLTVLGYVLV